MRHGWRRERVKDGRRIRQAFALVFAALACRRPRPARPLAGGAPGPRLLPRPRERTPRLEPHRAGLRGGASGRARGARRGPERHGPPREHVHGGAPRGRRLVRPRLHGRHLDAEVRDGGSSRWTMRSPRARSRGSSPRPSRPDGSRVASTAIPVRTDVGLLYYRRDLLAKAGLAPPRTLPELATIARAPRVSARGSGATSGRARSTRAWSARTSRCCTRWGGFWVDAETLDVGLDRPGGARARSSSCALQPRERRHQPAGVTSYKEDESRRLFQDGRAVFLRNWPYVWRLAQARGLAGRGQDRRPAHAAGATSAARRAGRSAAGASASRARAATRASPRSSSATRSRSRRSARCAKQTGYLPALAEAYRDPALLARNPFLAELETLQKDAVPRPAVAALRARLGHPAAPPERGAHGIGEPAGRARLGRARDAPRARRRAAIRPTPRPSSAACGPTDASGSPSATPRSSRRPRFASSCSSARRSRCSSTAPSAGAAPCARSCSCRGRCRPPSWRSRGRGSSTTPSASRTTSSGARASRTGRWRG